MALLKQSRTQSQTAHHQRLRESLTRHGLIAKDAVRSELALPRSFCRALRLALQDSGDIACLFGLYLSSRIDLFSPEECHELSRIPDCAPATPFAEVRHFVEQELGCDITQAFLAVEPTPYDTSLLRDSYRAMLASGKSVSLQVLRRGFRFLDADELAALHVVDETPFFRLSGRMANDVVTAFAEELQRQMNFLEEARSLDDLALDAQDGSELFSPMVIREFCRRGVLTVEIQPSVNLWSGIAAAQDSETSPITPIMKAPSDRLAHAVYFAWLRQFFLGRVVPAQFSLDDVFFSEDGRLGFLGCAYTPPPTEARESLWRYLMAVAEDDPDECCQTLLGLMHGPVSGEAFNELLTAFRQAITGFMAEPGEKEFYTGLTARTLRHLQLARQLGYRPLPPLLAFYRGIFSAAAVVRALQPTGDPLQQALETVWVMRIFGSANQMMKVDAMRDIGSKYLAAMLEFPMKLDAMLSQAARQKGNLDRPGFELPQSSFEPGEHTNSVAAVLLLTALLLIARSSIMHLTSRWSDAVSFIACLLIGLIALRMAAQS